MMHAQPSILIDVRTASEQKKGIVKNAICMDIFNDNFESQIDKLDRNLTYYVFCGSGGRSSEACDMMKKKGFGKLVDMEGGFGRWKNEGMPVEQR